MFKIEVFILMLAVAVICFADEKPGSDNFGFKTSSPACELKKSTGKLSLSDKESWEDCAYGILETLYQEEAKLQDCDKKSKDSDQQKTKPKEKTK